MIDVLNKISQHESYSTDHSQLLISYDTVGMNKSYTFDHVMLAYMGRGAKEIVMKESPGFSFIPDMLIMSTNHLDVDVIIPEEVQDNPALCYCLEIDKDKVRSSMDRIIDKTESWNAAVDDGALPSVEIYGGRRSAFVIQILDQLNELITSDARYKDKWVELKIDELILCCLQTNMYDTLINFYKESKLVNSPIDETIKYLKDNFDKKLTIEDLTKKACMSQATLFRHFKNKLGITPIEFINAERIRNAEIALLDPSISVGEVGYMVGYSSPSYFNSQFKKHNGSSPTEFRNRQKNSVL